jgi:hypothetical protein
VFQNRVLRKKSGLMRTEGAGGCRRLHNEGVNISYSSSNIQVINSGRMRWTRHVARIGWITNACNILFRKTLGKRPLERTRRRWKGNIKMELG